MPIVACRPPFEHDPGKGRGTRAHSTRPSRCRVGVVAGLLGAAALFGGCQTYEPRPVDLDAVAQEFLRRSAEAPQVADFARSLGARGAAPVERFDLDDGVSLPEAEVVALFFNAELREARARAGVAEASSANAGLWDDPVLSVDLSRIVESASKPWMVATMVGFTIPLSGRLEVERALADASLDAELLRVLDAEWRVRIALRRAWASWEAESELVETTRTLLEQVEQVVAIADRMESLGELARTEARLFRIEQAMRSNELVAAEARRAAAELEIRRLMGLSPRAPVDLRVGGGLSRTAAPSAGALDEAMRARSIEIAAAAAEHAVAERALELEIRRQFPDLHLGGGYEQDEGVDKVLFGLSLPLPVLNANRRAIAEARARRDTAQVRLERTFEEASSRLAVAEVDHDAARALRVTIESALVPLVDAQYADARAIARLGELDAIVLLESIVRQQSAKVQLVRARLDEALALARIEEIVGPPRRVEAPRSRMSPAPAPKEVME